MPSLLPVSADVSTVPKSEALTTPDSKEPVPKKRRHHTQKSLAKDALGVEASASTGSGGTGAEGRKKQRHKSFCAASTALTGVMLKQVVDVLRSFPVWRVVVLRCCNLLLTCNGLKHFESTWQFTDCFFNTYLKIS